MDQNATNAAAAADPQQPHVETTAAAAPAPAPAPAAPQSADQANGNQAPNPASEPAGQAKSEGAAPGAAAPQAAGAAEPAAPAAAAHPLASAESAAVDAAPEDPLPRPILGSPARHPRDRREGTVASVRRDEHGDIVAIRLQIGETLTDWFTEADFAERAQS